MEEKNNVPELRFPEFSGVWEKHKLGDIEKEGKISLNRGNVIPKGDGPYPVYSSSVKNNGLMGYSNTYMFDRELVSWSIDGGGDFFYRPKHKFSVTNVSGYIDILDDTYLCYKYLAYELQFLHSFLHFDYQTKAHPSVIRELYTIAIPSVAEQEKIGAFISNLDNLIALHQRKLDDTKELKKCLLQKMFPKDGEDTPELRFPGFSVPWEQRKLSDLVGMTYGGGTPATSNESYWNGDIPWIQSSNTVDGQLFEVDVKKHISKDGLNHSAAQMVPKNSVAVVTHVGVGKLVFMPYSYTTSQDFISLSDCNCNPKFLCYSLYRKLQEDLHIVQGSAIKGITKDDLMEKQLVMPSIEEQVQITNALESIDKLITLHQRKLDDLKALKKCLLQEMFI